MGVPRAPGEPGAGGPSASRADRPEGTVSWRELLDEATRAVAAAVDGGLEATDPAREARWMVEEASGMEGPDVDRDLDELVTVGGVARLDALVARRVAGEPIQYVLGHWPFRHLDLLCDPRVLIPRPETEQLVDRALAVLDGIVGIRPDRHRPVVVDLGTGSGAIGLAVTTERPGTEVWMVDVSADAVAVARANLAGLGMAAGRVQVVEGSWFDPLPADLRGRVDLVVSNPPYVAADEPLPASVATWEPIQALVPGTTGLEAYRAILGAAPAWLAPGGAVVAEMGATQGEALVALARDAGFLDVEVASDHAGLPRIVVARRG